MHLTTNNFLHRVKLHLHLISRKAAARLLSDGLAMICAFFMTSREAMFIVVMWSRTLLSPMTVKTNILKITKLRS